jgi:hypothetical protein
LKTHETLRIVMAARKTRRIHSAKPVMVAPKFPNVVLAAAGYMSFLSAAAFLSDHMFFVLKAATAPG